MKKLAIIMMLLAQASYAQEDTLDLFGCLEAVEEHHPTTEQKPLIHQQTQLKLKNLKSGWYPSLNLNAQVSYQSDIVKIDMDLPFDADFPSPSKDQYQATLDVKQMIYDGGITQASRETEKAGERLKKQSVEVDLYQIKDQVMEVYFGILLLNKQQAILETTGKELDKKRQTVQAAVDHGALLPSDLKTLQAEQLKLRQNLDQVEAQIKSSYQILGQLTGLKVEPGTPLKLPAVKANDPVEYQRPENKLYDLKAQHLKASQEVVRSQKMPKVSVFGQFGYGKPGLNLLNDEFDTFYYGGARLSWNIWDWNQNKRERQIKRLERRKLAAQEQSFNKQVDVQLSGIKATIAHYKKALERDARIIQLREDVTRSAKSKLKNGVITSSDYISGLNQLTQAQITHERHKIELLKARVNHLFTKGALQ
ncbi:MAG: TolC family protein [Bacteroidales bacterium]|nr:TolC family protein [Bacteroidales bacterium]